MIIAPRSPFNRRAELILRTHPVPPRTVPQPHPHLLLLPRLPVVKTTMKKTTRTTTRRTMTSMT
jgi:hypothetical protein